MSDKYKGNIAAEAWDKTKTDTDPDFDAIPNIEFKQNLEYRASKVRETGVTLTNFEKEVANIIATAPKDDAPMAVVDSNINFAKAAEGQVKNEGASATAEAKPKTDNNPQPTDKEAPANDAAVKKLVKENNRAKLLKLAKKAGLDGNSYTNKNELAAAIVAAQSPVEGAKFDKAWGKPTAGAPQGDQSGHVPTGEEAASIVKEESTAPLHP